MTDRPVADRADCICFVGPAVAAYCPVHHPSDRPVADREPLSAEEEARHTQAPWPPYRGRNRAGTQCAFCNRSWPCDAARLLATLATLDAARSPDEAGLRERIETVLAEHADPDADNTHFGGDALLLDIREALAQPTVPVARTHEETCQRCAGLNLWSWTSDLWNRVMRGPSSLEDQWSVLCPRCFSELAESEAVVPPMTTWQIEPQPAVPVAGAEEYRIAKCPHCGDELSVRAAQPEDDGPTVILDADVTATDTAEALCGRIEHSHDEDGVRVIDGFRLESVSEVATDVQRREPGEPNDSRQGGVTDSPAALHKAALDILTALDESGDNGETLAEFTGIENQRDALAAALRAAQPEDDGLDAAWKEIDVETVRAALTVMDGAHGSGWSETGYLTPEQRAADLLAAVVLVRLRTPSEPSDTP